MTSLRVSVVIPTQDTVALTSACLASLQGELSPGDEIVVVDDGSTDGTAETLAKRFPRARLIRQETARGFSASVNCGLATSSGDLLFLLNSDTEVAPGTLAAIRDAFREDPRLGIAGARLRYSDGRAQWSGGPFPGLAWLFLVASGLGGALHRIAVYRRLRRSAEMSGRGSVDWVTGAAMVVRHETYRELGPLDTGYTFYCQDLDYCWRARSNGWEIRVLGDISVTHHHGATIGRRTGITQDPRLLWPDLLRWSERARGRRWAQLARWVMRGGARLRLLARSLELPLRPREERANLQRTIDLFRSALKAASEPTASREGSSVGS